ncbi:MAG TPA: ABC transporter permease, partial [Blastocatellia bacterium]|nr:ABC transporter permease [Blastocatellia bacterium]
AIATILVAGDKSTPQDDKVLSSETSIRRSPRREFCDRLKQNNLAMIGLYVLIVLYGASLLAGFIAPYKYDTQNDRFGFYPPMLTRIHVVNRDGRLVRPFVYGIRIVDPSLKGYDGYSEDQTRTYPIRILFRGDSYSMLGFFQTSIHLFGVDRPGLFYLLGSDLFGRDLFSRIMYGSQISLSVGLVGILISTIIGMLVGGISGYFGGSIDFLLMRLVEVILAIPSLYFILILRQTFGSTLSSVQIYLLIVVILAFVGWATEARVIRGMVLSLKEKEFVLAARALGFSRTRILIRHILPNTISFVIVTAALSVPFYIVSEVALSFLGVGIQEPQPSWGNMLSIVEQNVQYLRDYTWLLAPGVFIFVAVLAWNFLAEGLRDAADPRALN